MNSDLYCLIYTSSAWNDMQAEDIRALASRSSANNKSKILVVYCCIMTEHFSKFWKVQRVMFLLFMT